MEMLCLFRFSNPPKDRRCWLEVEEDVGPHESDPTIQWRKEGCFLLELDDTENRHPTGVDRKIDGDIFISPLLASLGFKYDDMPERFAFGNGSGGPTQVVNSDGETLWVTWCVFPNSLILDDAKLLRVQEIFEGIPPGNPEEHVWKQFDENGRDPDVWDLDGNRR